MTLLFDLDEMQHIADTHSRFFIQKAIRAEAPEEDALFVEPMVKSLTAPYNTELQIESEQAIGVNRELVQAFWQIVLDLKLSA